MVPSVTHENPGSPKIDSTTVDAMIRPRLIGREHELELIGVALGGLDQGRGSVVHLVGEAGVGKTALIEEVRRRAAPVATVRSAIASDSDQRRPLACARQLLPDLDDQFQGVSGRRR